MVEVCEGAPVAVVAARLCNGGTRVHSVGMDMVAPAASTSNQWTRRLVIAVRGVAVVVLVRNHRRVERQVN